MRQGISTRYLGPTHSRGSRIKALARKANGFGAEMSHTRSYGYGDTEEEHTGAAHELAEKLGWSGLWIGGGTPSEDGFQYVNLNVGPDTDLSVHMGNLYSLREGRDWFFIAPKG